MPDPFPFSSISPISRDKLPEVPHWFANRIGLASVDILPMAHAVESHFLFDDIIPHPIGPYLQAPLPGPLAFQFPDVWRWPKGVVLESFEFAEDLLLN